LKHRTDYDAASERFPLADPVRSTGARWFDAELARDPREPRPHRALDRRAGREPATKLSFATLSRRSNQVANFLRAQGLKRRRSC